MEFFDGKAVGIELPQTVELTVVETEPGLKSATASSVTNLLKPRPAWLCMCRRSSTKARRFASIHRKALTCRGRSVAVQKYLGGIRNCVGLDFLVCRGSPGFAIILPGILP